VKSTNGSAAIGETALVDLTVATEPTGIFLPRIKRQIVIVPIVGLTPYIPHKFAEKALAMMRDKQQGKGVKRRDPKNPEEDAHAATHWYDEENRIVGCPAVSFKAAIVGAVREFEGLTIVRAKTAIWVRGDGPEQLVRIEGTPVMFEAAVRNATGVADLRYRNRLFPWSATLFIRFPTSLCDAQSVVALTDAAGAGGIGDWRPSAPKSLTGSYGQWTVATDAKYDVIEA